MKKFLYLFFFYLLILTNNSGAANQFIISSRHINYGEKIYEDYIFNRFGCNVGNIFPQISWKNVTEGFKSFDLTVYDPNVPTGSGGKHYNLVNILLEYAELPTDFGKNDKFTINNNIIQIHNDFRSYKFGGPYPRESDKLHRYFFTIYALKSNKLDIPELATSAYR